MITVLTIINGLAYIDQPEIIGRMLKDEDPDIVVGPTIMKEHFVGRIFIPNDIDLRSAEKGLTRITKGHKVRRLVL